MNMEEVEVFTAPGEGQHKKLMELGEAGFAADQETPLNQRAHIPKHHSELIKFFHLSSLPNLPRKPHHQTPGFFRSRVYWAVAEKAKWKFPLGANGYEKTRSYNRLFCGGTLLGAQGSSRQCAAGIFPGPKSRSPARCPRRCARSPGKQQRRHLGSGVGRRRQSLFALGRYHRISQVA